MTAFQEAARGRQRAEAVLLRHAKERLEDLDVLLDSFRQAEEDGVYRYYHRSFKVYALQALVREALAVLRELAPSGCTLDGSFASICRAALEHDFDIGRSNANWDPETRPILEAFWHCEYFLEQLARYGRELSEPSGSLPSGWAAVLELYGVR